MPLLLEMLEAAEWKYEWLDAVALKASSVQGTVFWDVFHVGILMYILETLLVYLFHLTEFFRTDCRFSEKYVGSIGV